MYIHVSCWTKDPVMIKEIVFKVPEDISWCIDWDVFDELFLKEAKQRCYYKMTYKLTTHPDL